MLLPAVEKSNLRQVSTTGTADDEINMHVYVREALCRRALDPAPSHQAVYDPLALCFFLQTFGEFLDPLAHVHFNVEGTIEFTSMLFIPGMAPFEQQNWSAKSRSIKLYVRRVFISDEFDEDLMPRWGRV